MATAILSPYKAKEGRVSLPRDASFSSYLDTNDREFVRNLTESIHIFTPAQDDSSPGISMGRKPIPRSELGVFGAKRYFNEKVDNQKSPISRKDDRGQRSTRRNRIDKSGENCFDSKSSKSSISLKSPTPNPKSKGSWNKNNQIGFFLPKKASVVLRILSGFQCTGLCFDKKSVYTATTTTTPTTNTHQTTPQPPKHYQQSNVPRKSRVISHHQTKFAFPIIDTISPKHNHCKNKVLQDQPRKSLEVFGSSHQLGKQEIEKSLERKLSILTWDAIPNTSLNTAIPFPNIKNNNNPTRKADDSEVEDVRISDASSDLFEIDKLSGICQELDTSKTSDVSSCRTLMTHHDAPSEASIEWSVVTASLAEVSAVSDDHNNNNNNNNEKIAKIGSKVQRNSIAGSSTGLLLLGCRNHKAVDVVGDNFCAKNNASKIRNSQSDKGSPDIAPSTPSRRSSS